MKKLAVFVLAVIFALSIPICAYASKNDENVKAESVVLMCLDTGDVLYEKQRQESLPRVSDKSNVNIADSRGA